MPNGIPRLTGDAYREMHRDWRAADETERDRAAELARLRRLERDEGGERLRLEGRKFKRYIERLESEIENDCA